VGAALIKAQQWIGLGLGAIFLCTGLAGQAAAAPKISSKTIYFTVSGSTPSAVLRSILRNGAGGQSGVAMATTQADISQTVKPRGKRGCRYSSKAEITTRLPRLSKVSRKHKAVRAVWRSFDKYIRAHEAWHKSIYLSCARKIDKKARAHLRKKGCKNAKIEVTIIMLEERVRCARLNRMYDQRERKQIGRLPLIKQATRQAGGALVFGSHSKKRSKRLAPNRN